MNCYKFRMHFLKPNNQFRFERYYRKGLEYMYSVYFCGSSADQVDSFGPQHTIQECGIGITESIERPADYEFNFNCIYISKDVNMGYFV